MPFGSSKAAMMGAAGGSSPVEFSNGSSSTIGDYTYMTYAYSGSVICDSGGEIDLLLVGGGGGSPALTGSNTGGAGGGGVLAGSGIEVEAGTYSLTIGDAGDTSSADNGGDTIINIAGWNLYACGGGYGGYGGWAACSAGGSGTNAGTTTPYQRAGGAGGGGGVWYGYCAGGPGYGQQTYSSGTGTGGGTWSTHQAGNGWGSFNSYNNVGGGGGGAGGNTASSVEGVAGYTWLDGNVYGSGGDGGNSDQSPPASAYGRGAGYHNQASQAGVLIVRYLTDG